MSFRTISKKIIASMAIISMIFQFSLFDRAFASELEVISTPPVVVENNIDISSVSTDPIVQDVVPIPTEDPIVLEPVPDEPPTVEVPIVVDPIIEPVPTPTEIIPESILTPVEPVVIEPEIILPTWVTTGNSATTGDLVKLNVTYVAPQNSHVTVKFTKLPEIAGNLTIKEIKLSSNEQELSGSASSTVYDITSNMVDGTFLYDLTLPLPVSVQNKEVVVKSAETVSDLNNAEEVSEKTSKTGEIVTIKGLNHFTVFTIVEHPGTFDFAGWLCSDCLHGSVVSNDYIIMNSSISSLTSPTMDFTISRNQTLSFNARTYNGDSPTKNNITISISTDNGVNWTTLKTITPLVNTMVNFNQIDLSGYNSSTVKVKFETLNADSTIGAGIDDIKIEGDDDIVAPELDITGFTADGATDMAGNLTDGYKLNISRTTANHTVQFKTGSVANENLAINEFPLYLQPAPGQTAILTDYYQTQPLGWRTYLIDAASGTEAFAYIKGSGDTSISLMDGAQFHLVGTQTDMVIPDDAPTGTYTVSGDIKDLAGNTKSITLKLIVADPVQDAFTEISAALTSQNISNNLNEVASTNYTAFTGLYFEKSVDINGVMTRVGRLTFTEPLDLSDSTTTTYLQDLGMKMDMNAGKIGLNVSNSDFADKTATIVFYNLDQYGLPSGLTDSAMSDLINTKLVAKDDAGNTINITDVVSSPGTYTGGTFTININHFTTFEIDNTPPTATVDYSTTTPTNQDVVATITASESIQENGLSYTFTDNGSHTFNFTDLVGNVGSVEATVSNIDKTAPTATVDYSITEPTNQDVLATITPSEQVTGSLTYNFTQNDTYTFNFTDLAGNTGSVVATVNNIDKTAPTVVSIDSDGQTYNLATTNSSIKITFSEDIGNTPYVEVHSNQAGTQIVNDCDDANARTFCFTYSILTGEETLHTIFVSDAQDLFGNTMTIDQSHTFNVDTLAPTITVEPYNTNPTNQNVTVNVSTNGQTLNANSYEFTDNDSFDFVAYDSVGNSTTRTVTITNIDRTVPTATVGYSIIEPTKQDVVATITPSESLQGDEISRNFTENGTYTFNFIDLAGNAGSVVATVSNIDTTNPIITLIGDEIINIVKDSTYIDAGATATDNFDGDISFSIEQVGSVNTAELGEYTITYDVSDGVGNEANQVSRTVNVIVNMVFGLPTETTVYSDIVDVQIPGGITVISTDPTWNGVVAAPTVTTFDLPAVEGQLRNLISAIEIGFADAKLSFNKGVRLSFAGQAGNRIGYSRPGEAFTEITNICAFDNQTTGDALVADGDCKIDVGSDLVVWTKHFTKFVTFTQSKKPYHFWVPILSTVGLNQTLASNDQISTDVSDNGLIGSSSSRLGGQVAQTGFVISEPVASDSVKSDSNPKTEQVTPEEVKKDVLGVETDNTKSNQNNYLVWYIIGGLLALLITASLIRRNRPQK